MSPQDTYAKLEQRSDEWKQVRWNKFITASNFGTVLGQNPFQTPAELFKNMVARKNQKETPAMTFGSFLEDRARHMLAIVLKDQYAGNIEIRESGLWWNTNWPELGKY